MKYIILSGGTGSRLKFDTETPKPFLGLGNGEFLLEHQINWLLNNDVQQEDIILAISREVYDYVSENSTVKKFIAKNLFIKKVIEDERLGTGGAVKQCIEQYPDDLYYVFNCDDLIFGGYNPIYLAKFPDWCDANILASTGIFPYGVISNKGFVTGFKQKPEVFDRLVYTGHMVIKQSVKQYLPTRGSYEDVLFDVLISKSQLYCTVLDGEWKTVNDYKQLLDLREYMALSRYYINER